MQLAAARNGALTGDRWALSLPPSVLLSALYAGLHSLVWVLTLVTATDFVTRMYSPALEFAATAKAIGWLLLAYLAVDLWRWRLQHPGSRTHGYVVFGAAAGLVALILSFLSRAVA